MRKCGLGVEIVIFVALVGACGAYAGTAQQAASISEGDAQLAGLMFWKATKCHETEAAIFRFSDHVNILTRDHGSSVDGRPTGDTRISPLGAKFTQGMTCATQVSEGIREERSCPPNPYLKMSCRKFLRLFRSMKITRSDWQASQGFR